MKTKAKNRSNIAQQANPGPKRDQVVRDYGNPDQPDAKGPRNIGGSLDHSATEKQVQ